MIGLRQLMIFAGEVVRYLSWWLVSGLVGVGASFYCGHEAVGAWKESRPAVRRPSLRTRVSRPGDQAIAQEAAAGIAEIEAFLGGPVRPRDTAPSDGARDRHGPPSGRS